LATGAGGIRVRQSKHYRRCEMNYEEFKMYMQAGYIDEMDINGLREIASGNFAEGGMTDEDIALASEIGEERWAEFADKLADELEEVLK
jgi:hypothetical protein